MPHGVVEEEQRDAREEQRDEVRDDEGAATPFVRDIGEAPDVAQPDG